MHWTLTTLAAAAYLELTSGTVSALVVELRTPPQSLAAVLTAMMGALVTGLISLDLFLMSGSFRRRRYNPDARSAPPLIFSAVVLALADVLYAVPRTTEWLRDVEVPQYLRISHAMIVHTVIYITFSVITYKLFPLVELDATAADPKTPPTVAAVDPRTGSGVPCTYTVENGVLRAHMDGRQNYAWDPNHVPPPSEGGLTEQERSELKRHDAEQLANGDWAPYSSAPNTPHKWPKAGQTELGRRRSPRRKN